jgi:hypothetical protein
MKKSKMIKEVKLKSEVVRVKGRSYRMFFTKRIDVEDGSSWVWTQIKPYNTNYIMSSYMSSSKIDGYRKGMAWLKLRGR